MAVIPHIGLPFRLVLQPDGSYSADYTEQDSIEEISDCVEAIVRFEKGRRPEQPDFGIADTTFSAGLIDTEPIDRDIEKWEPRAAVKLDVKVDTVEELVQRMAIEVST